MCIKMENKLVRNFIRVLYLEEICLSTLIKDRARELIKSNDESPAATAGLVCIAKEADLTFKLYGCKFTDTTDMIEFSNKVRRSASNLIMINKDSEFTTAAAGAMLGMAEEAMTVSRLLSLDDHGMYLEYLLDEDDIRVQTAKAFTKLEEEFASKAAVNAPAGGTSEKPIGCEEVKGEVGGLEEELKEKMMLKKIGNETKGRNVIEE